MRLGLWAWLTLTAVFVMVVDLDLARFRNPIGEKDLLLFPPGQCDFSLPYIGARALLAGVNPYRNDRDEFSDKVFQYSEPIYIDGEHYKMVYPPSQLLLYVPLAYIFGDDWEQAGRVWFHIILISLVGLAGLSWWFGRRIIDPALSPAIGLVLGAVLALNIGVELGVERGQSDNFFAFLCWAAVMLFVQRRYGWAMFAATVATSIKGYPIIFAAGLALLALDRRSWKRALGGGVAGIVLMIGPVLPYLYDGWKGLRFRGRMFWDYWYNHSFRNVIYSFAPSWAHHGRTVMLFLALGVCFFAWLKARRAFRTIDERFDLWLVIFAIASLATMIGHSATSVSYDLILIFPGCLILVLTQRRLTSLLQFTKRGEHVFGAALAIAMMLLFKFRLGSKESTESGLPAAGYGLVLLLVLIGIVSLRAVRARRDEAKPAITPEATPEK